jgi:hypothetical protein
VKLPNTQAQMKLPRGRWANGAPTDGGEIATWSLASIALFAVWMLGILSVNWLAGFR